MLKTVMRNGHFSTGLIELANDFKKHLGEKIVLVEIGSYMGESAEIFAQILPKAEIICIDPFEGNFDSADPCSFDNYSEVEKQFDLRTSKYENIQKFKGYSTDFKINCNVVYIDGRHFYEGVKEDILHWKPLVSSIISGHDYYDETHNMYIRNPHIQGVKRAVNEVLGNPDKTYIDGSWMKIL